jgi:hypothetical protein
MQAGGYLKLTTGLNKEAVKFTDAITSEIKKQTTRTGSDGVTY